MSHKVSLESLDSVKIPNLEKKSKEETLFETAEVRSHQEHKLLEAHQNTLSIAKEKIRKLEIENDDLDARIVILSGFYWDFL